MIISLSSPVYKWEFFWILHMLTRSERLIFIHIKAYILQRLPLTRAFAGFLFCLFKPEFSWTSINCFHGFPRALTEKVPSSLNEGRIISNDDGFFKLFYWDEALHSVKTTEWNSRNILYSLRNGFQVVYLFDVWKQGSCGRLNCQEASINLKKQKISHRKRKKFPLNGGCFWKWILLLIILHVIE